MSVREVSNVERFQHDPQRLLEDCPNRWADRKLRAAIVIVLDEEAEIEWSHSAFQAKDLLWAVEQLKHRLMNGEF